MPGVAESEENVDDQSGIVALASSNHSHTDVNANPNSKLDRPSPFVGNDSDSNTNHSNRSKLGVEKTRAQSEAATATAISLTMTKLSPIPPSEEMVDAVRSTIAAATAVYASSSSSSSSSSSGLLYEKGDPTADQELPLVAGFGLEQADTTTVSQADGEYVESNERELDEMVMGEEDEEEAARVAKSKEKQRRMTRNNRASPASLRCLLRPGEKRLVRVLYCPSVTVAGSNEGYPAAVGAGIVASHSTHHDQGTHNKNHYNPACVLKARTFHIRITGRRALTKKQVLAAAASSSSSVVVGGSNNPRNIESGSESGSESQSQLLSESEDERQSKRLPSRWGPPQVEKPPPTPTLPYAIPIPPYPTPTQSINQNQSY